MEVKQKLTSGHTNISYKLNDQVIQEKIKNPFNHKLDNTMLAQFDFVPELLEDNEFESKWKWIEHKETVFTDEVLKQVADNIKILHDSELKFPKSNVAARVKEYRKILKEKNVQVPILDKYYKKINLILKHSENNRPLHNDLRLANILVDMKDKVYFIDWEYASMGDKHFDLAYFICHSYLTKHQEQVFLDQYDSYWEEYLIQQKILVHYLTILWINAQPVKPFSDEHFINELEKNVQEFNYKKQTQSFRD
ncbi:phosphotransferase [Mycoplasma nasistruthionis]|uniref:Aminoglycoside phosphotransferase domain-containing protein n=1 Tax=Mycoplasma nasistruthionis TaxID=353852 RepID=A0A4Y6I6Z8_9MOLU|nr:phosphotransferase [Mycoplasma nasistruthionis]QDF65017.1 hypothetical protein FIV53_01740 [Mycoplasma nasistruthionis]